VPKVIAPQAVAAMPASAAGNPYRPCPVLVIVRPG
jgi:hypothetical protein